MLKIFTFGGCRFFYNNKELEFETQKAAGLLIYLLLNPKNFLRDAIAYMFWGKNALKNLSMQIFFIKKKIPSKILNFVHKKDMLSLEVSDKIWIDVLEFKNLCTRLERASGKDKINVLMELISIYKGNFLENFYIKRAVEFTDWALLKQEELKNEFINILNKYCLYYLEEKKYNLAAELAKVSLKIEPFQEEMHQKLMYLYNATGQKNLIVKQYEICKNILAKEGFSPSEETKILYEEINGKKFLEEEVRASHPKNISSPLTKEEKPICLLGRKNEFNFLTEKIEGIKHSPQKVIFISGPPGIGKTRLAVDVLKKFIERYYVIYGTCYQFQSSTSFHPFIAALKNFFQSINYQIPLKGIWMSSLLKLFPEIKDKLNFVHVPVTEHKDLRMQIFESFQKLLINLSVEHPLILFIDNFQWADEASLELLSYMARNIQNAPILFLVNLRYGEKLKEDKLLYKYISDFENNNLGDVLKLENIAREDMPGLFKGGKKENELIVDCLYKYSSGNPFLLNEILKFLSAQNKIMIHPDGKVSHLFKSPNELPKEILTLKMKDFMEKCLENLTSQSRSLLETASALEENFDASVLEKIGNVPGDKITSCLEELLGNRLLKEQIIQNEIRYSFIHDNIRDYIYVNLSHTRRAALHQTIAELMEKDFKSTPEFYNKIAFHYDKGLKLKEALKYYELAAEYAESMYRHKEAVDYYEKLIKKVTEDKDLVRFNINTAEILTYSANYAACLDFLNKAQSMTEDIQILIKILDWKIYIFHYTNQIELKNEILDGLKKVAGNSKVKAAEKIKIDYLNFSMSFRSLINVKTLIKNIKDNVAVLSMASMPKEEKLHFKSHYYYYLSLVYLRCGSYKKARPFIDKAIFLAQKMNFLQDLGHLYYHLARYFVENDDCENAMLYMKKVQAISDKINSPIYDALIYNSLLSNFYIKQMDFERARYYLDKARAMITPENKSFLIRNMGGFVEYFLAKSNIAEAEKYFKEYTKLLDTADFPLEKINSYVLGAKILWRRKEKRLSKIDIAKIENLFFKAITNPEKVGYICKLADTQYEFAMFERTIKQTEKCGKYLKEALKNYKLAGNKKKVKHISNLLVL